jgi:hypothetical protein
VWLQCPIAAAIKMANIGRINVGWSMARLDLMKKRPVQYYILSRKYRELVNKTQNIYYSFKFIVSPSK